MLSDDARAYLQRMAKRWPVYDVPFGEPLPGSRLIRVYCVECGEPLRANPGEVFKVVDRTLLLNHHLCERCMPHKPLPHNSGAPIESAEIQYSGGNFASGEW